MKTSKEFFCLLLLSLGAMLLSGCEDDMPAYYEEKEFALDGFNSLNLGSAFQVEITYGDEFLVVAKGESQDLEDLELVVANNTLSGSYRHGSRSHKRTLVQVYMPVLRTANLHSATNAVIKGFSAEEDSLRLLVSGAAKLATDAEWRYIEFEVNGASELVLEGKASAIKGAVNGASNLQAADLFPSTCDIAVSGASEATVGVRDLLSGSVNGNSQLQYRGSPVLDVEVAADSRIKKL